MALARFPGFGPPARFSAPRPLWSSPRAGLPTAICLLCVCLLIGLPIRALGAAQSVYHEQSTRSTTEGAFSTDCSGPQPYVEILSPASGQSYVLRFRLANHSDTDQARVYYTTDGSDPVGSLGNGTNATQVIVAAFSCVVITFTNVSDICLATIPAQPSGTTVKYMVSAWASSANDEIFGNSGACPGCAPFTNSAQATIFSYTAAGPPRILSQPQGVTNDFGGSAAFSVTAAGFLPLTYQWFFNSTNSLTDATNSSLVLTNLQPTNSGNFQVVVRNDYGMVTSAVAKLIVQGYDYGDAPPGYPTLLSDNGARHRIVPGFFLGSGVDFEPDGQPDPTATGDNLAGANDEDGVSFAAPLRLGQTATAIITASTNGLLQGWIDFNANTNWADDGEQIFTNAPLTSGVNRLSFPVPAGATLGPTFARFRFSSVGGLSFTGAAPDGEVEDYAVTIQPAVDLTLTLVATPSSILVGGNVTYTITVGNLGLSTATGVTLADSMPDRATLVSATASQGSCSNTAGLLTCGLGTLPPGSNATVTVVVQATVLGTLTNNVSVSAVEFDVNPADNTASSRTAVDSPPRAFSNPTPITIDDVENGPAAPYPSTIVVSGFTAAVYKVTATLSNLSHTFPDDLDILLAGPNGKTVMLLSDAGLDLPVYSVNLTFDDDATDALTNSDQIISGTFRPSNYPPADFMPAPAPPGPYGDALSVFNGINPNGAWSLYVFDDSPQDGGAISGGWSLNITSIDPISDLAVTQRALPNPGAIGTNVVYTLTVTNFGPAIATAVKLTDSIPAGLSFVSLTSTSGSCTNDNGLITCAWASLTNGAGARVTLTLQPTISGFLTNNFRVSGQQLDQNPTNNSALSVISVTPVTDIAIAASSSPARVLAGQTITYTATVTNQGINAVTGVAVSDPLPNGMIFVSAAASQGSCSNSAGTVTCALGNLAPGASATLTMVGRPLIAGSITNLFSVAGNQFDQVPANNTATVVNLVDPAADLAIRMKASPQPVGLRQPLTYLLTVSNQGPSAATSVIVRDALPATLLLTQAAATQGGCVVDGAGVITCDLGGLDAGATAAVTLSVTPSSLGNVTNLASLTGSPIETNSANNAASVVSTVIPAADLAMTLTGFPGPVWLGENLTYALLVTNRGPSAATGIVLQDILPDTVSLVSLTSSQGSCANQAGTIFCNLGSMPSGGRALITLKVLTSAPWSLENQAGMSGNELDPDLSNNGAVLTTDVIVPAAPFASTAGISIPDAGPAVPYPSTIQVSGLTAAIQQVRVVLTNLSHTRPDDLDILLVGPGGQAALLMSDSGGETGISNVVLRFDDQALLSLPDSAPITSGTYKPTDYEPGDAFPPPAPAGPYGTALSVFNGIDPNGPWSLYVLDDSPTNTGSLGGWSLDIAVRDPIADVAIVSVDLPALGAVSSNLLFSIVVSNQGPATATIVELTNQLPAELQLQTVVSSQGFCINDGGFIFCELGDLPSGSTAVIDISVIPSSAGPFSNVAGVMATELDLLPLNNVVAASILIEDPPVITLQPMSLNATNGDTVTLTALAAGTEPLSYQWQQNGFDLLDATNTTLVLSNVDFLNSGAYSVRVTNRVGTALSQTALLAVVGPPYVSDLPDQTIDEDTATGWIPFLVEAARFAPEALTASGSSSDPSLVANGNIQFGGTGSNRMVRVAPLTNRFGSTVISVSVSDPEGGLTLRTFLLTVVPVNDPPVIALVPDQVTPEDTPFSIAFTVDDLETPAASLLVSVASSNPALVPSTNLVLAGSGNNRTLTATPLPDQSGTTLITLTVTDENTSTGSTHFLLTVTPVNDPPTLAPLANLTIDEGAGPQTVALTGISAGATNEFQRLRVTAVSDHPEIIPNPAIVYTSANSTGTLSYVPVPKAFGTATITVTVNDSQSQNNTTNRSFTVTIRPVNDAPTLSRPGDQTTPEDTPISLPLIVGDDGPLSGLTLTGTSSAPGLVPATNIVFGGAGGNRTLTLTPAANQFGTATITLTVTDTNGAKASNSFVLTVTAVNDPPTLDPITNRIVSEDAGPQTVSLAGIGSGAANESQTLTVTALSSNPALIPNPTVTYTNPSPAATLRFTPATNATGSAVITVTVSDGQTQNSTFSRTFTVTVTPVNDPPFISSFTNMTTPEDVPITIPFTVSDSETSPFLLAISGTSSNATLVPNTNIWINGTGSNRTVTILPASNQTGTTSISLRVSDGVASATNSFLLTVAPVNDPPTLNAISDVTFTAGGGQFDVGFSGVSSGASNETQTLIVTAVSSNTALLTFVSVNYHTPAALGSVRFKTASSAAGAVPVTVTVNDGGTSNNLVSRTFTVFLRPATNTAPTMSAITNRTILEDTPTGPLPFTVNDTQTPPGSLVVTGRSSNLSLVPNQNIIFGGSGSNRTVNITPATNQTGTAVIMITVMDAAFGAATNAFVLTVNPTNDRPIISGLADKVIQEDTPSLVLFAVEDAETPAASLIVTAHSSDQGIVTDANLVLGGNGTNRVLWILPGTNQNGTATITLTVSDGLTNTSQSFLLTVSPVNDPPSLSSIPDQSTAEDTPTPAIAFTVNDTDSPPGTLLLSALSSNPALVSPTNVVFGGSGTNRTVRLFPATNQFGSAVITLTVSDTNGGTASQSFQLNVTPVNDPPTLDLVTNLTLNFNPGPQTVVLTGIGPGATNENQSVLLTASSGDVTLIMNPSISYTNPSTTGTLSFTPVPGAHGVTTISVTANDGQIQNNLLTRTFTVTITAPPVISEFADQTIDEDTSLSLAFTVGDLETPAGNLLISATSSNPTLLPAANLVFGGSGADRTLTILPATNAFGTSFITLAVVDGDGNSTQSAFLLTVNSVADVPIILAQPQSQTVTNGTTLRLQVTATTGLGPLRFQWTHDGTPLPGQTNSNLTLPSVTSADDGAYVVTVSAPEGSVASAAARVRVLPSTPTVIQIVRSGTTNQISFPTIVGPNYTIEYKAALTDPSWLPLGTAPGTGEILTIEDPDGAEPMRIYRLRVE